VLSIYALLVVRSDETIQEVTCQILLPHFDFEPFTYTRAESDQLYQSVQIVINSLSDSGEPVPGAHCQFCPARLICRAAKDEAANATLAKVIELPLGEQAAGLLDQIKRAQALFRGMEGRRTGKPTGRSLSSQARILHRTQREPNRLVHNQQIGMQGV
jgi:Protein of unknown function (DUF2800)